MRTVVLDWFRFLEQVGGSLGMPLAVMGLGFMLAGWRLGRIAIIGAYALAGLAAGRMLGDTVGHVWICTPAGAAVGILVGLLLNRCAAAVLTGLASALTLWTILGPTAVPVPTIYILLGVVFFAVTATSIPNDRVVTVLLTAFIGACMLVSAMVTSLSKSPTIWAHVRQLTADNGLVYSFVMLAATVTGSLLQLAAIKRKDCGHVTV